MNRPLVASFGLWLLGMAAFVPPSLAAQMPPSCAGLAAMKLPDTTITSAEEVTGGSLAVREQRPLTGLPAFCRVTAVTRPAIRFEVWLPLQDWNGRFQGVGNGANAGSIGYEAMATALRRGYATAGTDTGHATSNGRDAAWALGHPELVADFGYRSIHVTADNGKKIVGRFYGRAAEHAYFVACSTGGRQSLMEAQRFPDDYDGIIAGAPAANWSRFQTGGHLWVAAAFNKDPESYLPPTKLQALGDAVNAACDRLDGIADGVIADPRQCAFDARALQCPAGQDNDSCLTPKQAQAVNDVWAGARTAKGEVIYPGYNRGAEAAAGGWNTYMTGTGPLTGAHWVQAENTVKYIIYGNPDWKLADYDVEKDAAHAVRKVGSVLDAFDPDLSKFRARGGRLLLYHGFNDPSISPLNTINYYEQVKAEVGKKEGATAARLRTEEFVRLFLVPGMLHCGGGPGTSSFDMVSELEKWVEQKQAPERILASHVTNGKVDRTRPLCPYPKAAVYGGKGSTDEAASFECR